MAQLLGPGHLCYQILSRLYRGSQQIGSLLLQPEDKRIVLLLQADHLDSHTPCEGGAVAVSWDLRPQREV